MKQYSEYTFVGDRAGVNISINTTGSIDISIVAHVIIARCMFSCAYMNSFDAPVDCHTIELPKCLFKIVPTWYAAHVASGISTVGTGLPPRRKMKQYSEYWNPLELTIGSMLCFTPESDHELGRFTMYPILYRKPSNALPKAAR